MEKNVRVRYEVRNVWKNYWTEKIEMMSMVKYKRIKAASKISGSDIRNVQLLSY